MGKQNGQKQKPIDRLMAAMGHCAQQLGEAQWTNGYRAAVRVNPAEEHRLYEKEQEQWKRVGVADTRFRRLALRLLREAAR